MDKSPVKNSPAPTTPNRYRLLALVESENRPINAERGPKARRYNLNRGDANWFFQNISCQDACPAHTDVARYIAYLAGGDYDSAQRINLEDNLFPGILGRICARPCETACRRGKVDDPIAICSLKRGGADFSTPGLPLRPERRWPEKVAIVGAGPAGLAAANGLAKAGYGVEIFESQPVAGGMLRWGIPRFRLPDELCKREIDDYFAALGVKIHLNTPVGPDHSLGLADLRQNFEAVFIAAGTQLPHDIGLTGQESAGVIAGLDYMEMVNLAPEKARAITGQRVAVIGGGFTAMDCARSALRLGAEAVYVLYRRSWKELQVGQYEVEEAEFEGSTFHYLTAPLSAKGDHGQASGIVMVYTELGQPGPDGRQLPRHIPGSEFELQVETIITATGQNPQLDWLGESFATTSYRDLASPTNFATAQEGVFAGGDFTQGSRNVISAVADGRKAAYTIDAWLRQRTVESGEWPPFRQPEKRPLQASFKPVSLGHDMRFDRYRQRITPREVTSSAARRNWLAKAELNLRLPVVAPAPWTGSTMFRRTRENDHYQEISRRPMPVIPLTERKNLQAEVETGLDRVAVHDEARRCLQCQLNIFIDASVCILCNTCVDVCPTHVIKMVDLAQVDGIDGVANPPDLVKARRWEHSAAMIIDEDMCVRCGECVKWCPTGCLSMQSFEPVNGMPGAEAVGIPLAAAGSHSINLLALAQSNH